jgi:anaerobic ribonucleoside-triphosphate reductase activating protein
LEALLRGLRRIAGGEKDILVYSGYAWEQIGPRVTSWEGLADALISEPFRAEAGQSLVWRGSDNQRMNLLTALGRARYTEWVDAARAALPQALDIFFQDGEVWMAGIPAPGTLEILRTRLAEAGFDSTTTQARASLPVFA